MLSLHLGGLLAITVGLGGCSRETSAPSVAQGIGRIDFNRHIRPILNQHCVGCHGGVKTAGGIGFVFREEATRAGESGRVSIVPGRPEESELMARITSTDEEFRMPKPEHGPPLSAEQIAQFRQWIAEGAEWAEHWAFVPPQPQRLPAVRQTDWPRVELDHFILAKLEQEGLSPAPAGERAALLRRVSFDLTGLPPTLEELDAFLADPSPDAYEEQVDRLLASPHYGERWASPWLDLARYADSKGYEADRERTIWTYRDWVIDALNRNLPYDQFVLEQLAGDLLPEPTLEQLIATAFHRNTQTNDEGGTDDEEFRVAAVLDRVSTTWLAFNGVTFNCVQCHSHPYDPIRHEEFFTYLAFFNNTRDADLALVEDPYLWVPNDPGRYDEALQLHREGEALRERIVAPGKALVASSAWEPLPIASAQAVPAATFALRDGEALAQGTVSSGAVYELTAPLNASKVTALRIEVPPLDAAKARHNPELGFIVNKVEAWLLTPDGREQPLAFRHVAPDDDDLNDDPRARRPAKPAQPPPEQPALPRVSTRFASEPVLRQLRWWVGVPERAVEAPPGSQLKLKLHHGRTISNKPAAVRRVRLSASANPEWTTWAHSPELAEQRTRLATVTRALDAIPGTDLPITKELSTDHRRETRVFVRGNFLEQEGSPLKPDVPALFPPLPADAPRDRLTLAHWLVAPEHPLTARVAVNRFWELLFGVGLVETSEDFGSAGTPPSHPELLDALALRFAHTLRWDMKALLKELVTSSTYRQSVRGQAEAAAKDPTNRWLARGPRLRLSAEMVRDQALVASGLFNPQLHGPPVMPPQPEGVWASVYNAGKWEEATGPDRYRRGVYTFWKRTSAYKEAEVWVKTKTPASTPFGSAPAPTRVFSPSMRRRATCARRGGSPPILPCRPW